MNTSLLKIQFNNGTDYNTIIKKFNIKVFKDNKIMDAELLDDEEIKRKVIRMKIDEPDDIFNYDYYVLNKLSSSLKVIEL